MTKSANNLQGLAWAGWDERTTPRIELDVMTSVTTDKSGTVLATLADISSSGARIVLEKAFVVGTWVTLDTPGWPQLAGWVAWHRRGGNGIDFAHAVPHAIIARLNGSLSTISGNP